jgi:hypothetical protein
MQHPFELRYLTIENGKTIAIARVKEIKLLRSQNYVISSIFNRVESSISFVSGSNGTNSSHSHQENVDAEMISSNPSHKSIGTMKSKTFAKSTDALFFLFLL